MLAAGVTREPQAWAVSRTNDSTAASAAGRVDDGVTPMPSHATSSASSTHVLTELLMKLNDSRALQQYASPHAELAHAAPNGGGGGALGEQLEHALGMESGTANAAGTQALLAALADACGVSPSEPHSWPWTSTAAHSGTGSSDALPAAAALSGVASDRTVAAAAPSALDGFQLAQLLREATDLESISSLFSRRVTLDMLRQEAVANAGSSTTPHATQAVWPDAPPATLPQWHCAAPAPSPATAPLLQEADQAASPSPLLPPSAEAAFWRMAFQTLADAQAAKQAAEQSSAGSVPFSNHGMDRVFPGDAANANQPFPIATTDSPFNPSPFPSVPPATPAGAPSPYGGHHWDVHTGSSVQSGLLPTDDSVAAAVASGNIGHLGHLGHLGSLGNVNGTARTHPWSTAAAAEPEPAAACPSIITTSDVHDAWGTRRLSTPTGGAFATSYDRPQAAAVDSRRISAPAGIDLGPSLSWGARPVSAPSGFMDLFEEEHSGAVDARPVSAPSGEGRAPYPQARRASRNRRSSGMATMSSLGLGLTVPETPLSGASSSRGASTERRRRVRLPETPQQRERRLERCQKQRDAQRALRQDVTAHFHQSEERNLRLRLELQELQHQRDTLLGHARHVSDLAHSIQLLP